MPRAAQRNMFFTFAALSLALPAQSILAKDGPAGPQPTFAIVHDPALKDAAEAWTTHRAAQGWTVRSYAVPAAGDEAAQRDAIRDWIRRQHADAVRRAAPWPAVSVLLLGDVPEESGRGIPTFLIPQTEPTIQDDQDPRFASDQPYQLMDEKDDLPDVPLGRVPARTSEQALAILQKIKRFEAAAPQDPQRWRIAYVAGEGHFGPYDQLLEKLFIQMVDQMVPPQIDVSMLYANPASVYCPPPSKVTACVLDQLGSGAMLFNYLGHGHAFALDSLRWRGQRFSMLKTADLRQWEGGRPGGLALLTCCSTGWFDRSDGDSLAEVMLNHSAGPIAVIAGSRETHPYANTAVQRRVTQLLMGQAAKTVGELDLRAARALMSLDATDRQTDLLAAPIAAMQQWKTSLIDLRRMHMSLYNLLGDPATALPRPPLPIEDLKLDGNAIRGRCEGLRAAAVTVQLLTARQGMADAASIIPVTDVNDPELEAKAAGNYARANQRVLREITQPVTGEEWTIRLPEDALSAASFVRVWIRSDDKAWSGAVRVLRPETKNER